ncbi:MAG: mechanosensitive ion channel domain-containing protein, partial [bacterium]
IGASRLYPFLHGVLMSARVVGAAWMASAVLETIAAWWLERAGRDAEERLDRQLMPLLRRVVRAVLAFVAATVILGAYDIKIAALLGAAGVASLAVALAAQDSLANMIGGLTIMVDRPFRVGDRIELNDGRIGDVAQIGIRSTRLLTYDRTLHILPNAELMKQPITNHSFPDRTFTIRQTIGVAYGSDVPKAKALMLAAAVDDRSVLKSPPPAAYLIGFGESSLDVHLVYTIASYAERLDVLDRVNLEINRRLAEGGIDIPFPTRTVHLRREGSP